jgi:type IV secretion system protein VirD4
MILYTNLIKIALANMMRMATRDPLWAIVALSPFRCAMPGHSSRARPAIFLSSFTVSFGIDYVIRVILDTHRGDII